MRSLQHPTDPPPETPSWSAGERISFGGLSDKGSGYMAYSERVGPGVLVLHDGYGLIPSVKRLTDRFVAEGFTALAVDLYDGRVARNPDEARALAAARDPDEVMPRLRAAAEHLSDNWHPRLGLVGFSVGASWATALALQIEVDATVVYYGGGDLGESDWGSRPLLGHFATDDATEAARSARASIARLDDAEAFDYDAPHGFANADLPDAYSEAAASLAMERTLEELHYQLS
ncbi:MAG: dienelactone hydrolase family protein [Actinomycetota bacterium]